MVKLHAPMVISFESIPTCVGWTGMLPIGKSHSSTAEHDKNAGHQSMSKIEHEVFSHRLNGSTSLLVQCTLIIIITRGQSNLTKSTSRGAHSPVRGHPRGSKFVPLNSWGRVSY